jgi:hypothetical protein
MLSKTHTGGAEMVPVGPDTRRMPMISTTPMTPTAPTAPLTLTIAPQVLQVPAPDAAGWPVREANTAAEALRCVVCGRPFAFAAGEAALVLRHTAYGYDFAHDGPCLAAARERLFPEPGYDGAAFGRDPERRRILAAAPAAGWAAVLAAPEQRLAVRPMRLEPLRWWVLLEHRDGSRRVEGLVRDAEWLDEPGGAEFPEAAGGGRAWLGYAAPREQTNPF